MTQKEAIELWNDVTYPLLIDKWGDRFPDLELAYSTSYKYFENEKRNVITFLRSWADAMEGKNE